MKQYTNPYKLRSIQCFQQTMNAFKETYKVERSSITKFDNRGRVSDIKEYVCVEGFIEPLTKRLDIKKDGNWVASEFQITLVYPYKLRLYDKIITEEYGTLVVMDDSGKTPWGSMQCLLVRVGSTGDIYDNEKVIEE